MCLFVELLLRGKKMKKTLLLVITSYSIHYTKLYDFRIDGEVEGTINCNGKVVIGQKGYLKGSITCINAEVVGTVEGDINVSETLSLRSTSVIKGDVKTKILMVEPNAEFNGTCTMSNNDTKVVTE